MDQEKDEQIMSKLQQGETQALGLLFERYKTIMLNYFIRMAGDYDTAGDLLMTVFERVFKYRMSYSGQSKFRSWLFQIGNNVLKDYWRKQKRESRRLDETTEAISLDADISEEQQMKYKMLHSALEQLPINEKNRVTLHYLMEMNYEEIAALEGISTNAARISVHRGLKKLNELLKNSGI
ncbi:MAG: RNA polymerase sigma factor [Flavobacteriaceae bacterium]|nr:RNA polymerase sigma factor [Flavobacteriaceae bacterium]